MLGRLKADWHRTKELEQKIADKDQRWQDIVRRRSGTNTELLEADFGKGGPNGLNIKPWPQRQIGIKSIKDDEEYKSKWFFGRRRYLKRYGGFVNSESDSEFYLQPKYFGTKCRHSSIYGHENTHIDQHARNNDMPELYSGDAFLTFQRDPEQSQISQWVTKLKRARLDHIAGGRSVLTQIFSREAGDDIKNYYARNNEMQARMHEILAAGYLEWEIMPTTKTELWAAMHNMGVDTPDSILQHLEQTEEGRAALEKFFVHPAIQNNIAGVVGTFNDIQDYLDSDKLVEATWQKHYPMLCGELLEFYGDIPGRARMDAGINPRPVLEAISAVMEHEDALSEEQVEALSASIPAELATLYINNLIIHDHHYNDDKLKDLMHIAEALLEREDVKAALFEPETITAQMPNTMFSYMPLYNSLVHGKYKMTELLLNAGAPTDQKCVIVNILGEQGEAFGLENIPSIIQNQEAMLSDKSKVNRRARKNFYKPENLDTFKLKLACIKDAYDVLQEHLGKAPELTVDTDETPEEYNI